MDIILRNGILVGLWNAVKNAFFALIGSFLLQMIIWFILEAFFHMDASSKPIWLWTGIILFGCMPYIRDTIYKLQRCKALTQQYKVPRSRVAEAIVRFSLLNHPGHADWDKSEFKQFFTPAGKARSIVRQENARVVLFPDGNY